MTITSTGLDLAGTASGAINPALQAEGFSGPEAFSVRGLRLSSAGRHPHTAAPSEGA